MANHDLSRLRGSRCASNSFYLVSNFAAGKLTVVTDGKGSSRVSHFSPKQAFKVEGQYQR